MVSLSTIVLFVYNRPWYTSGKIYDDATTFTLDKQKVLVVARNVPAKVCRQCGEAWITDDAAEKLEKIVSTIVIPADAYENGPISASSFVETIRTEGVPA